MWRNSINYEDYFSKYKSLKIYNILDTFSSKRESFKLSIPQDIIIELEGQKEIARSSERIKFESYKFPIKVKTSKLNPSILKPMMHVGDILPFKLQTKYVCLSIICTNT